MNREHVIESFKTYTADYDLSDPKIKLKFDHTFRVAGLCNQIAESINLSDAQKDLAWLIGMLHDVGRFEQVRRYGTFTDADSIDHANFGADLLFLEGLFFRFIEPPKEEFFDEYEKNRAIVETAIRNHSAFRIEEGLDEETLMFCQILRDADKIDILRVNCDTPVEEIYNVTTKELKEASVTKEVKDAFDEHHCVLRNLRKTPIDFLVGHISLCFELVYPISMEIVKQQGYLEQLLNYPSENKETLEWFSYMKSVLLK